MSENQYGGNNISLTQNSGDAGSVGPSKTLCKDAFKTSYHINFWQDQLCGMYGWSLSELKEKLLLSQYKGTLHELVPRNYST